jgi:hypothetical protein
MKEYKFRGLDRRGNIKEGIIVFTLGILIIGTSLYYFHGYIRTLITAIFFITFHAFIIINIYLLFVVKFLTKEWRIIICEDSIEFFYSNSFLNKFSYQDLDSITIRIGKETRIIQFETKTKTFAIYITNYLFLNKAEREKNNEFIKDIEKIFFNVFEKDIRKGTGYNIIKFYKK